MACDADSPGYSSATGSVGGDPGRAVMPVPSLTLPGSTLSLAGLDSGVDRASAVADHAPPLTD
eukprot:gene15145-23867_t